MKLFISYPLKLKYIIRLSMDFMPLLRNLCCALIYDGDKVLALVRRCQGRWTLAALWCKNWSNNHNFFLTNYRRRHIKLHIWHKKRTLWVLIPCIRVGIFQFRMSLFCFACHDKKFYIECISHCCVNEACSFYFAYMV